MGSTKPEGVTAMAHRLPEREKGRMERASAAHEYLMFQRDSNAAYGQSG